MNCVCFFKNLLYLKYLFLVTRTLEDNDSFVGISIRLSAKCTKFGTVTFKSDIRNTYANRLNFAKTLCITIIDTLY